MKQEVGYGYFPLRGNQHGHCYFLGIMPDGFGNTFLLGAVVGVLIGIFHQLTKIHAHLKNGHKNEKHYSKSSKIPVRR
ncbi:hypothetical protein LCL89_05495 [Halobacillus yeomjeoni]|uniref:hypothetical protein n=1 Tax=Halobacillus yeomjeoni TaxID=311194 RepID=UPI001CD57190|nr:hypothetical protein [Halobacillus yeomjeoni]MCA0983506.1 hypothetical protein [Halobacillus yeomjeoni]